MSTLSPPSPGVAAAGGPQEKSVVGLYVSEGMEAKRPEFTRLLREAVQATAGVAISVGPGDPYPAGAKQVVVVGVPAYLMSDALFHHVTVDGNVAAVVMVFAGLHEGTRRHFLSQPALRDVRFFNLHHNANATSEMAIALLLSLSRRVVLQHRRLQEDRAW